MCEKKWLEELLRALDGHTAASLAKAENALSRGFKPFDVFIAEVRQAADRLNDGEQRDWTDWRSSQE